MPAEDQEQRTEQATPRRREEQRKKGKVASSRDLNSTVLMFAGLILLYLTGPSAYRALGSMMQQTFGESIVRDWTSAAMLSYMAGAVVEAVKTFAPVFLGTALLLAAAAYGQVGLMITGEPLTPKFNRLNPISGFGRLVSMKSVFKLGVTLAKVATVAVAIYLYLRAKLPEMPLLVNMTAGQLLVYISKAMLTLSVLIALVLLVLAAIDYGYQRYQHEKEIKMTPHEVKEELKRAEGDRLVKARVRQIQTEMARSRMMTDVPDADVIVRNPTHFAVALKYDAETMSAPAVVAKGINKIAERIIEIAEDNDIPTVENKPLARELYRTVDIGNEVPGKFYRAVAEVLAYVYKLRGRTGTAQNTGA